MAITVVVARNADGSVQGQDYYENGESFQVVDGNLFVTEWKDGFDSFVGAYAPAKWLSVSIDGRRKFNGGTF